MIVDTSALVAVLLGEPGSRALVECLDSAGGAAMSAGSLFETFLVIDNRRTRDASAEIDATRRSLGIHVHPVTHTQVDIARIAHARYGRGSGSPARLNFGDCFAYALATELDEPLLFVGEDFAHTDVRRAIG